MAVGCLAYRVNVGKILRTPGGQFCGHKICTGNEVRLEVRLGVNYALNPALPSGVKIDGRDLGKNIEAAWITSKTIETAAFREVFRANALEGCAEFGERGIRRSRVSGVCFYENVEVLRKAG